MKANCRWTLFLLIMFLRGQSQDQFSSYLKNISEKDFESTSPLISRETSVIVLADIGHSGLTYEENGWVVTFTRYRRLRILNRNGLEACTVSLGFSADDNSGKKLKSLKATTYNLVSGKMEKTDLDPQQVFLAQDKKSDERTERFTMPNAREGSIIEYTFSIKSSNFENLFSWYFQGEYPRVHSEYSVSIPAFFNYAITTNGKLPYSRKKIDSTLQNLWIGNGRMDSYVYTISWEMDTVPAVQTELFVHRPESAYASLSFQISAMPDRYGKPFAVLRNWSAITNRILQREVFQETTARNQKQLAIFVGTLVSGASNDWEKAKRIFHFVRDSVRCTHSYGAPFLGPVKLLKIRSGNGGDMSLLLSTMLNTAGFSSTVMMLATKENLPLSPIYPFPDNINRLVVNATIGSRHLFLDPAHKNLAFGVLPPDYLNGYGIDINSVATAVQLDPDAIQEKSFAEIDAHFKDSATVEVSVLEKNADYQSYYIRQKIKEDGNDAGIFKALESTFSLNDLHHDSLDMGANADSRINFHYTASIRPEEGDLIYLNAMLNHNIKNNPFPAVVRHNPIEIEYPTEDIHDIVLTLPEGYQLDALPQSGLLKLNEKDGLFEYNISANDHEIHLYCRVKINKTTFQPADYENLRKFYASVIEKEGQMIILKKK